VIDEAGDTDAMVAMDLFFHGGKNCHASMYPHSAFFSQGKKA